MPYESNLNFYREFLGMSVKKQDAILFPVLGVKVNRRPYEFVAMQTFSTYQAYALEPLIRSTYLAKPSNGFNIQFILVFTIQQNFATGY